MNNSLKQIEYFEKFGSILGLERIGILLDKMGKPQENLKCIHIAGTNGKGSTSRFIYEVLREAGYRVGIYTSPFLEVFNERIEANGQYISDEELSMILDEVTRLALDMQVQKLPVPTEFDIVTAAAFKYFSDKKVDFVVLEVGLGGRADSTNIIKNPLVCAITSISLDHTDRLGETLKEIAYEKGGIIKDEADVVIGHLPEDALQVIEDIGKEKKATIIYSYSDKYEKGMKKLYVEKSDITGSSFFVDENRFEISMIGNHQIENAVTALGVLDILAKKGYEITKGQCLKGMKNAFNKGRMELISIGDKKIILDGAHNEAGMKAFVDTMIKNFSNTPNKIKLILGVLEDKDVEAICFHLKRLKTKCSFDLVITQPDNPRKLSMDKLEEILHENGLVVIEKAVIDDIIDDDLDKGYDIVAFVGSLYLIGEVRRKLWERRV